MTAILCLDDNFGVMFNQRRQSRDSQIVKRIGQKFGNTKIRMNRYSAQLFDSSKIICSDDFFDCASDEDICFVENIDISLFADKIDRFILYFWNRVYPSDMKFTVDLKNFLLLSEENFKGKSHEVITEKIYIKKLGEKI